MASASLFKARRFSMFSSMGLIRCSIRLFVHCLHVISDLFQVHNLQLQITHGPSTNTSMNIRLSSTSTSTRGSSMSTSTFCEYSSILVLIAKTQVGVGAYQ